MGTVFMYLCIYRITMSRHVNLETGLDKTMLLPAFFLNIVVLFCYLEMFTFLCFCFVEIVTVRNEINKIKNVQLFGI